MIPEIGHIFLVTSLVLSLVGGLSAFIFKRELPILKISSILGLLIIGSFFALVYSFVIDDFSVAYVAQNSNINLPIYYKFAATWGAHEGSLILWILSMNIWLVAFLFFDNSRSTNFSNYVFGVCCLVIFSFLLFTIFTSNPFERILPIPPINGADLNPSLQDFAFTVHPPLLYFGYSGLLLPFAISISAMLSGQANKDWASSSRPWTLLACSFLTIGIGLGSWWAYYELGWGGWWFWDPVENAAFVPWLLAVALVHSLLVTEKRNIFINWSLLLSIFAFAASLLGTFLVRSGILTSVHAFALDPERGLFILGIFSFFVLGGLLIFAFKNSTKNENSFYSLNSKEFGLLLNNLLLVVLAVSILFGTLYPLIYEAITDGKQISVGAPYFEFIIFPFAIILGLLQGMALYLSWGSTKSFSFLSKLLLESISISLLTLVLLFILFDELIPASFFTIFIFAWILAGTLMNQFSSKSFTKYLDFINRRIGVLLSHTGMALLVLGVGVVSSYSNEIELILKPGEKVEFINKEIEFLGIQDVQGPNYISKTAEIQASDDKSLLNIKTEKRTYFPSGQVTTEAGIDTGLFKDFYVSLGDNFKEDSWSFRLQSKPFIRWIWLGALLITLGTFISGFKLMRKQS
jgi:cytochrome c-type biogenesis protein CcmF|tara:strand:- start:5819 stop:7717 length:1899 start_codon:yes stop_codon:yes gene_type:complete